MCGPRRRAEPARRRSSGSRSHCRDRSRRRVGRLLVRRDHLDRRGAGRTETVRTHRHIGVDLGAIVAAPADIAEKALDLRAGEIAIAGITRCLAGGVHREIAEATAILERALTAVEGAAAQIELRALPGEAVLHVENDGAANGVEAVKRIASFDRDIVDGDAGDEVPIDRVAPHLVDAHAVLEHGEALRHAGVGRRGETAIIDLGEGRIAANVVDDHTRRRAYERVGDAELAGVGGLLVAHDMDRGRHLIGD